MVDQHDHKKPISGTLEWAVAEIDCCTGCSHDCRYCYARYREVVRDRRLSAEQWQQIVVNNDEVARVHPRYPGQVMFPTAHDILPENLDACLETLTNLLSAGNRVLVVSKPHLSCIEVLCRELAGYRDQLLYRFTITARNQDLLSFWEPGAPSYEERVSALKYAHDYNFRTSVSVEPMLDTADVVAMVKELLPWVNHSIWLGKMNKIDKRVVIDSPATAKQVTKLEKGQTDAVIFAIYRELCQQPLVRWKESIKDVVGLERATRPGQDM